MLIALFTMLFLGGSTTGMLDFIADTQSEVGSVMERGDRRSSTLETLDAMEARTEEHVDMVENASEGIRQALADFEANSPDIDAIWSEYFAQRAAYNREMLDLRFQLRDQLTREEWEQVFGRE
jgi:hypothetical protein